MPAKLVYMMGGVSLDGFVETKDRSIDWTAPSPELARYLNEILGPISAFLQGRRVHEMMAAYWPTAAQDPNASPTTVEYARIWREKPKYVFSRTRQHVEWGTLVKGDAVVEVPKLKAQLDGDLCVGGAALAAPLIQADLVDEFWMFVRPIILGGGTPFFPPLEQRLPLRLIESRTFGEAALHLGYARAR